MGLGASAGDPLIEFDQRAAAEHGYDVAFDNFADEGDTKFTAAYGANDLPDMFETDYPYMGGFLGIGALVPLPGDGIRNEMNPLADGLLPGIPANVGLGQGRARRTRAGRSSLSRKT